MGIISKVLASENFLIKDVCNLIDSYLLVTDDDRIKFMFASRGEPEVLVSDFGITNDLDEILEIKYARPVDAWPQMSISERIADLETRSFCVYVSLPNIGSARTEYTLFALMADIKRYPHEYESHKSEFRWKDVFMQRCEFNHIGEKLHLLWAPSEQELAMLVRHNLQIHCESIEKDYEEVRECLLRYLLIAIK
jgi:hypothetical protein